MSQSHGRRYLLFKIQMAAIQPEISETMTYIIKIPTANLRHSTMANLQEVYLGN